MKTTIDNITWNSFREYPVWEWDLEVDDDAALFPIQDYPVSYLEGRIIGVPCYLNNGAIINCVLSAIEIGSPHKTDQFLSLTAMVNETKIQLQRYFDVGASEDPGKVFADNIGIPVDDVFPIKWDVQKYVTKGTRGRSGTITRFPAMRLNEQQRMYLIFS